MLATVQKIKVQCDDTVDKVIKYYTVLFTLDNLILTRSEIELLAFTAVRGNISSPTAKEEFCNRFGVKLNYIESMKSKLLKRNFLIKKDKKHKVNPKLLLDFSKGLTLQLDFKIKEDATEGKKGQAEVNTNKEKRRRVKSSRADNRNSD